MPLKKGKKAPDFTTTNQDGKTVSLSDFLGKKVVLYFYSEDNSPTCTLEACNLRDNYKLLQKEGYVVIGVSPDSAKRHTNFRNKLKLPFDLLVDEDLKIIKTYKLWAKKKMFGNEYMGVLRTTYLIDEEGMISEVIEKVLSKNHTAQILG